MIDDRPVARPKSGGGDNFDQNVRTKKKKIVLTYKIWGTPNKLIFPVEPRQRFV